ncbi:MAG: hypothetical protein M1374_01750 [Firmicutes bacterium]|jgi:hypothetical protein|nr:hypothetical protein [Bacillota bacterium]
MSSTASVKKPKRAILLGIGSHDEPKAYLQALLELFSVLDERGFSLIVLQVDHADCQEQKSASSLSVSDTTETAGYEYLDPITICAAGIGRTLELSFGLFYNCTLCGQTSLDRATGVLAKQINSLDFCSAGRMRIVISTETCLDEQENIFREFIKFLSAKFTTLTEDGAREFELKPKYAHPEGFLPMGVLGDTISQDVVLGKSFPEKLAFQITKSVIIQENRTEERFHPVASQGIFFEEYLLRDVSQIVSQSDDRVYNSEMNIVLDLGKMPTEKVLDVLNKK